MAQVSVSVEGERRGAPPVLFGTILFLASELLFFGGLFAAYYALRAETSPWPPNGVELDVVRSAVATVLLVISSFTFQAGVRSAGRERHGAFRNWTIATILLGVAFLGIQIFDYTTLPFSVSSNAYGTMYYAMTGMHALHVFAGLLLMVVVLGRAALGAYRGGRVDGLHASAYYWHFVDVVWVALFATLFLVL
jgi:cytochrome c oxidase subunit 3